MVLAMNKKTSSQALEDNAKETTTVGTTEMIVTMETGVMIMETEVTIMEETMATVDAMSTSIGMVCHASPTTHQTPVRMV